MKAFNRIVIMILLVWSYSLALVPASCDKKYAEFFASQDPLLIQEFQHQKPLMGLKS